MWQLIFRALLAARLRLTPPRAPERLDDLVRLFRLAHPEADADAWEAFCCDFAARAYWEGERRGHDRSRGLSEAALRARHDWTAPRGPGDLPALGAPNPGGTPEEVAHLREVVAAARAAGCEVVVRRAGEGPTR